MDGRVEERGEDGKHWRHMSDMPLTSGVTFSLMCRLVQAEIEVNVSDSTLANPIMDGKKKHKFQQGAGVFDKEECVDNMSKLQQEMHEFFKKHLA